jgi:hypothetical protein
MIIIDILRAIFGKNKKKIVVPKPTPVIYTPPAKNIDPITGEVINENVVTEGGAIVQFNRGLVLLERQKEAYRNLYMKIYKNYSDDKKNNAPYWQIDQHRAEEKTLLDAQNLDTKKAAKMCVDAYKLINNFAVKFELYNKYNALRNFFTNKVSAYGIYDVLSNIGFEIDEPIAPENKNDFDSQLQLFDLKRKQLGQLQANFNNNETFLSSQPKSNLSEVDIYQNNLAKDERLNKYNLAKQKLILNIQERAANLVRLFNAETNATKKTKFANDFNPIRTDLNTNFNNILVGTPYSMVFAQTITNPVGENPNVGGTQSGVGINVGNVGGTTTTPTNTGQFPDWKNQFYSPNNTVYYQGNLYNSLTVIDGTNNSTPDKDGRWRKIL